MIAKVHGNGQVAPADTEEKNLVREIFQEMINPRSEEFSSTTQSSSSTSTTLSTSPLATTKSSKTANSTTTSMVFVNPLETQHASRDDGFCDVIPSNLQGRVSVNQTVITLEEVETEVRNILQGGEGSPGGCRARDNVAIIVPYRDRFSQLVVFLRHIHPFLSRQNIHYRIYIINQADSNKFNRAMLMNVGFKEAMKDNDWDCFIFHDVDLLPEDDRNIYSCPELPRHMSVAVDKFKYKLPYKTIFGGVAAISTGHFKQLNGFSNLFWGWGGEDDDMSRRIIYNKLKIIRYKPEIARYTMIKHKQQPVNKARVGILRTSKKRYKSDGLNSLRYKLVDKQLSKLYTNVSVKLEHTEYNRFLRKG